MLASFLHRARFAALVPLLLFDAQGLFDCGSDPGPVEEWRTAVTCLPSSPWNTGVPADSLALQAETYGEWDASLRQELTLATSIVDLTTGRDVPIDIDFLDDPAGSLGTARVVPREPLAADRWYTLRTDSTALSSAESWCGFPLGIQADERRLPFRTGSFPIVTGVLTRRDGDDLGLTFAFSEPLALAPDARDPFLLRLDGQPLRCELSRAGLGPGVRGVFLSCEGVGEVGLGELTLRLAAPVTATSGEQLRLPSYPRTGSRLQPSEEPELILSGPRAHVRPESGGSPDSPFPSTDAILVAPEDYADFFP